MAYLPELKDGIISNGGTTSQLQVKLTLWPLYLSWRMASSPMAGQPPNFRGKAFSMASLPELEDGIISNGGTASQFQMAQEWATLGQNTHDVRRHTFHI
jgi:hypothetical protein